MRFVASDGVPVAGYASGVDNLDADLAERLRSNPQLASFQELYLNGGIDGVSLVASDSNACPACLTVTDIAYTPSRLPALPIAGCTSERGCRCRYEPNVTVYE